MLIRYLQFQEKCLYGGVAFMIKILIKLLSNVSYLFMPFTGDEIIDIIQSWCHGFLLFLKFSLGRVTYNRGGLTQ